MTCAREDSASQPLCAQAGSNPPSTGGTIPSTLLVSRGADEPLDEDPPSGPPRRAALGLVGTGPAGLGKHLRLRPAPGARGKDRGFIVPRNVCFGPETTEDRGRFGATPQVRQSVSAPLPAPWHSSWLLGAPGSADPVGLVPLGTVGWQSCRDPSGPTESRRRGQSPGWG